MGTDIGKEEFDEPDYARFAERLEECLTVLGRLLDQPGFGAAPQPSVPSSSCSLSTARPGRYRTTRPSAPRSPTRESPSS